MRARLDCTESLANRQAQIYISAPSPDPGHFLMCLKIGSADYCSRNEPTSARYGQHGSYLIRGLAGSLDQLPVPLCRCAVDKWDRILVKAHFTNNRSRYVVVQLTHNRSGYVVVRLTQNHAVSENHSESLSFEYAR